jgi:hypothetical protein
MTDLSEWLLACIAEDEADAQALADADGPTWTAATDVGDHYNFGVVTTVDPRTLKRSYDGGLLISGGDTVVARCGIEGWGWDDAEVRARHIARHDPARVLAECAAKRRIVELHRHEAKGPGPVLHDGARDLNEGVFGCVICSCVDDDPGWHFTGGWCQTVRLLALPYAGRDGYDERWRPEE